MVARAAMDRGRRVVLAVTLLAGLFMTAAGVAVLLAPGWFADTAGFPRHTHLVHHAGALRRARWMTYRMTGAAPRPGWFVPPDQKM